MMDRSALRPSPPSGRAGGQLREGLRYAARTPSIAIPLAMMGLVGLLAYEFSVSLPVLAERSFHGGAEAYGFMTAAMGIGAVIGGLFTAARGRTGVRPMIIASAGFGAAILVCAWAPFLGLAYAALLFVGWASVSFIAIGNSTIQLNAEPEHARAGDRAVAGRLPGHDAGGRPRDRLDHRPDRPADRPGGRRPVLLRGGDRRRRPRPALPPDGAAGSIELEGSALGARLPAGAPAA